MTGSQGRRAAPPYYNYEGYVDGQHWATLIGCFEDWAKKHCQPLAVSRAERMAATVNDIVPDLMMVVSGIVEAEWEELVAEWEELADKDPSDTPFWQTFDSMCEELALGYRPKDATKFVKDLLMRYAKGPHK
jgi:hypothetical protein